MEVKYLALAVIVVPSVTALEWQVNSLNRNLESLRATGVSQSQAIAKLEHDLFGRLNAQENAQRAALAQQDAARRGDIDQGLKGLPQIKGPVYWNEQ
ncbi:MAG: hypothetical protein JO279_18355 [Verrucomicrobia bacterium]|nr:hypothetical protein [Verrucomicrobiota bacterium]